MRSFENGRKMGGQKLFSRLFDILLDEKGGGERINIWKEVSGKGPNPVILNTFFKIFVRSIQL